MVTPSTDQAAAPVRPGLPTGPRQPLPAPAVSAEVDVESERWLDRLRPGASDRDAAIAELYALLQRAARFELYRRTTTTAHARGEELDDLATQAADDALVAILAKLHTYRGASRFTTWAYKFVLLEASVMMRRRAWQDREIVLSEEAWTLHESPAPSPSADAEATELLYAIAAAIRDDLTRHQREVLIALAVEGVPIDVLAERLNTTRGALYKTLHDARRKLRARLAAAALLPSAHHDRP